MIIHIICFMMFGKKYGHMCGIVSCQGLMLGPYVTCGLTCYEYSSKVT